MPAARAAYQSTGLVVRCTPARAVSTLARQLSVLVRLRPGGEEPARKAALVEPVGPVLAEQEGRLRADVGHEAGRPADRHLLPRALRWPAGRRDRSDGAAPAPPRSQRRFVFPLVARPPRDESHGHAVRQARRRPRRVWLDRRRPRRNPPRESNPKASSTAIDLDDAVQVEPDTARAAPAHGQEELDPFKPRWRGPGRRRARRPGRGEVAVVPGRLDRRAERRIDEALGDLGAPSSACLEHPREQWRDDSSPRARRSPRSELALLPEPAEDPVALLEQRPDPGELLRRGACDEDLATHASRKPA